MTREEAINNLSAATGEPEDIVERRADAIYARDSLPIVNYFNNEVPIEKPRRKSYVSPYARFDKIRKRKH